MALVGRTEAAATTTTTTLTPPMIAALKTGPRQRNATRVVPSSFLIVRSTQGGTHFAFVPQLIVDPFPIHLFFCAGPFIRGSPSSVDRTYPYTYKVRLWEKNRPYEAKLMYPPILCFTINKCQLMHLKLGVCIRISRKNGL